MRVNTQHTTVSVANSGTLAPGERVQLVALDGPGMIRHIRLITDDTAQARRGLVIRAWWDDQAHPSVETPVGDFFGFAHGRSRAFSTCLHAVGDAGMLDSWVPMPFARNALLTLENESAAPAQFRFSVDATRGDALPADFGVLHAHFRREAPTTPRCDFEFMPLREGRGRFLGTVFGVLPLEQHWWGEGEAKFYLDGDGEWPTLVGTGAEDYVGLAWNVQQTTFAVHGASMVLRSSAQHMAGPVSMYRWHVHDPIIWHRSIRASIQQIGVNIMGDHELTSFSGYLDCLFERRDDWSCCSFWYEPVPSAPLPAPAPLDLRLHGLEWTRDFDGADT